MAIVVDPDFGGQLDQLATRLHVWVADTPTNREAAERYWRTQSSAGASHSLEAGVTTFRVDPAQPPEDWCSEIVDVVEEHHGLYSHEPPVTELEIYGAAPTPAVRSAFEAGGFHQIRPTAYGFEAKSRPAG